MQNFQNVTLGKTADGLLLVEVPRSVHINPNTRMRVLQPAAPLGSGAIGMMVKQSLTAFDTATQVPQRLVGLDNW